MTSPYGEFTCGGEEFLCEDDAQQLDVEIWDAAKNNDISGVERLLKAGARPDSHKVREASD
jgi:hypothetical protein